MVSYVAPSCGLCYSEAPGVQVLDHGKASLWIEPVSTLVEDGIEAVIRDLKTRLTGEIDVGGPDLARSLTDLGLIDEYRLCIHPIVLGRGTPFFAGARPPLRLVNRDLVFGDVIRLTYVPA